MNVRLKHFGAMALAIALATGTANVFAQDGTKQDMKAAGHDTKDAAVNTGHGVKTGTEKAYHGTKRGTKKVYHKTKHGLKHVGHNIKKTLDPHANSQDSHHQ
jgi:hypothetical protein